MNNKNVLVSGQRLRLVPYLRHHVPRYHCWMSDPKMLELTASEPLTLQEEYENQQEWLCAEDKLTFIILAPVSVQQGEMEVHEGVCGKCSATAEENVEGGKKILHSSTGGAGQHSKIPVDAATTLTTRDGEEGLYVMIGDCNLFLLSSGEGEMEGDGNTDSTVDTAFHILSSDEISSVEPTTTNPTAADCGRCFEVEAMIAEGNFRRRGFGEEAVRLLMSYALDKLRASRFVAKVRANNFSSIQLFTSKLGFTLLKEVPVFGEIHYIKFFIDSDGESWKEEAGYLIGTYDESVERKLRITNLVPENEQA
ncbi:N-acetyltransferase, putative [Trypanosoma brucei gambiense DAL972]|uniref:N-acetyltransferase, putative n=2 Tax=Trypanosoma brucei TaxID=5691 RepID=C9ZRM3_TRYB9|nr:N-acetyltransferase, putative [Trypanosoma brucei gambiense DAL972]RHW71555.1 N-acetyltransferase [Trypanosoma brucei equiperdum]CBH12325.1 N-acetyltransferase, putative [Trypanosoma brucei gambiense DAL972]|eukprot:XP_011774606.1 N-acetyltransferase, putative [Trypanosoma brucei gambiense DAL972]